MTPATVLAFGGLLGAAAFGGPVPRPPSGDAGDGAALGAPRLRSPAGEAAVAPLGPATRGPIRRVATAERAVAITFDACAIRTNGYGFDAAVFDILRREGVPATIFVSGRWVEFHPDAMAELVLDPLIEFGDHSYDHPHMTRLPPAGMAAQIDRTEAALGRYGKHSVAFRPPFGDWSPRLVEVTQEKGLPLVTWDVVSGDPSARTTAAGMIRAVLTKTHAGSIVIFHINGRGWKTAEALPAILTGLRERGFHFVPLSHLLGAGADRQALR